MSIGISTGDGPLHSYPAIGASDTMQAHPDPVDAYFECISTCSLDDGECVTVCTEILRDQS